MRKWVGKGVIDLNLKSYRLTEAGKNTIGWKIDEYCGEDATLPYKLTEDIVLKIKNELIHEYSQHEIAEMLGVSRSAISSIVMGKTWKKVK